MLAFVLRRLLVAVPMIVVASVCVFALVVNLGEPQKLENALARPNASAAAIESIRRQFELDQPVVERYLRWAGDFVTGDFGEDGDGADVRGDLWRAMQVTLRLLLFAQIAALALGALVGVVSALRQYTAFDYVMTGLAFLFFSIPAAVLAGFLKFFGIIGFNRWARHPTMSVPVLVVLLVAGSGCGLLAMRARSRLDRRRPPGRLLAGAAGGLGVAAAIVLVFKWGWDGRTYRERNPQGLVPTIGQAPARPPEDLWQRLQAYFYHLVGPSLTLLLIGFAGYSRYMRASMLEALNADYVRTARAKGVTELRVVVRHSMRNALIPLTTAAALDFGALFSGAVITERIFAWKGMGSFFTDALLLREPRPLMAFVMVTALFVVVFGLVADVLYAWLDPRVRVG
jgi:ABC-type dipeptide/oligopeptide/nickel transport system permease component